MQQLSEPASVRACPRAGSRRWQPSRWGTKLVPVRRDHGIRQAVPRGSRLGDILTAACATRLSSLDHRLQSGRPPRRVLSCEASADRFDGRGQVTVCRYHERDVKLVVVGVFEETNRDVHVGLLLHGGAVDEAAPTAGQGLRESMAEVDCYASPGPEGVDVDALTFGRSGLVTHHAGEATHEN